MAWDTAVPVNSVTVASLPGHIRDVKSQILDENDMVSDDATTPASQQSIKAFVEAGASTLTNKTLTSPVLTTPQLNDTSEDHQYITAVSELTGDRTVTMPLLTGNDTFVFAAFAATLTNKTLTSPVLNTGVSGTAVLNEDDLSTDSDTQIATQQSIKAYVDLDSTGSVMHDAEGGFNNCDIVDNDAGPSTTKTKIYTKYIIGTLDADSETSVAHGVSTGLTKILSVSVKVYEDTGFTANVIYGFREAASASVSYYVHHDDTNIDFAAVGSSLQGNAYYIKIDYIL